MIRSATPEAIDEAARLIRAGRLVAFPTETVYGLGCDATNDRAVAAVFEAKGRPRFNPLIIHVAGLEDAAKLVRMTEAAERLARRFWPGPLTLVLPRTADCPVSLLAGAGLDSLAVRVPAHPVALSLLAAAGRPVAAPSANPSGQVSPTRAEHVEQGLGARVDLILDGGPCAIGLESTVLDLSGKSPAILRPGALERAAIEEVTGPLAEVRRTAAAPRAPGMLERHYATSRPLRLGVAEGPGKPGEALLSFGRHGLSGFERELNLSPEGDLREAAANLFAMLRTLDEGGVAAIAVMPIPDCGLGEAINDRLRRAAAGVAPAAEAAQME
ncbi:MAG: L-threonylcarbamoyladenylate synthase [Alphaproteobacteria bacterium]